MKRGVQVAKERQRCGRHRIALHAVGAQQQPDAQRQDAAQLRARCGRPDRQLGSGPARGARRDPGVDDAVVVGVHAVAHPQVELERKHRPARGAGRKLQGQAGFFLVDERKLLVAGKAVLRQLIRLAIIEIRVFGEPAH